MPRAPLSGPRYRLLWLDFHGVRVRIEVDDEEVARRVQEDFLFFADALDSLPLKPDFVIRARLAAPDYDALPELTATVHTPRNVCYTQGNVTYLDYFGRALTTYRREEDAIDIESENPHMLHEIVYLTLLSRVGEKLERQGLHRLHALAVGRGGESALFMMDSGGGKTTLGLGFLQGDAGFELVSEDSPLIDRRGGVHPFPLRFGVLPPVPDDIDEEHVYYLERMEFEPKYLISLRAFEGAIGHDTCKPRLLCIGRRRLGRDCVIRRVSRWAGFRALTRHMVVGVGLYQGLEFMLRSSPLELVRSTGVFASRLFAALRLLARVRVHVVELGRDRGRNVDAVVSFLEEQDLGRAS